jgi:hypothetical protein
VLTFVTGHCYYIEGAMLQSLRKYLLGSALLCSAISATAWLTMSPLLPSTSSPLLIKTFWRAEPPSILALSYKLRANIAGWQLSEQTANSYYFHKHPQRDPKKGYLACQTINSLTITLRPAPQGGTQVRMLVTGETPFTCPGLSP